MKARTAILIASLLVGLLAVSIEGYPSGRSHRQKRLSDQRLAELQTKLAYYNMLQHVGKSRHAALASASYVDHLNSLGRRKRGQLIYEEVAQLLQDSLDDVADVDYEDAESEGNVVPQPLSGARRHARTRMSTYQ